MRERLRDPSSSSDSRPSLDTSEGPPLSYTTPDPSVTLEVYTDTLLLAESTHGLVTGPRTRVSPRADPGEIVWTVSPSPGRSGTFRVNLLWTHREGPTPTHTTWLHPWSHRGGVESIESRTPDSPVCSSTSSTHVNTAPVF